MLIKAQTAEENKKARSPLLRTDHSERNLVRALMTETSGVLFKHNPEILTCQLVSHHLGLSERHATNIARLL